MSKKRFCVMIDCSNNAVMRPEKVKEYALYLKRFGYDSIMLYCEDTFEVDDEPYFGYLRGGYSKTELKDIVAYCDSIGVEVIPCIETLAHLGRIFKWNDYAAVRDTDDILLVGDERVYRLIENEFRTLAECFTSRTVNIGLDEAHNVGRGAYLNKHGYRDALEIFAEHTRKIVEIAKKYGFEPMMWSDMLFKSIYGSYYDARDDEKIDEKKDILPDVDLVYWEYFFYDAEKYRNMLRLHRKFGKNVWYAGAVHTYIGFTTSNDMSIAELKAATDACRDENIDGIIVTLWGGEDCSFFLALPALCYARCNYEGHPDEDYAAKRFFETTDEDYYAIRALDAANTLAASYLELPEIDFSKYVLFQDVFNGYFDPVLKEGAASKYREKAEEFDRAPQCEFKYLFERQSALLKAIYLKHDLGIEIRRAYGAKDLPELRRLSDKIDETRLAVREFYEKTRAEWLIEKKPHGLDVVDQRFGGLMLRLEDCAQRLKDYVEGRTDRIDELETPLKPFNATGINYLFWSKIVTANNLE